MEGMKKNEKVQFLSFDKVGKRKSFICTLFTNYIKNEHFLNSLSAGDPRDNQPLCVLEFVYWEFLYFIQCHFHRSYFISLGSIYLISLTDSVTKKKKIIVKKRKKNKKKGKLKEQWRKKFKLLSQEKVYHFYNQFAQQLSWLWKVFIPFIHSFEKSFSSSLWYSLVFTCHCLI